MTPRLAVAVNFAQLVALPSHSKLFLLIKNKNWHFKCTHGTCKFWNTKKKGILNNYNTIKIFLSLKSWNIHSWLELIFLKPSCCKGSHFTVKLKNSLPFSYFITDHDLMDWVGTIIILIWHGRENLPTAIQEHIKEVKLRTLPSLIFFTTCTL